MKNVRDFKKLLKERIQDIYGGDLQGHITPLVDAISPDCLLRMQYIESLGRNRDFSTLRKELWSDLQSLVDVVESLPNDVPASDAVTGIAVSINLVLEGLRLLRTTPDENIPDA